MANNFASGEQLILKPENIVLSYLITLKHEFFAEFWIKRRAFCDLLAKSLYKFRQNWRIFRVIP